MTNMKQMIAGLLMSVALATPALAAERLDPMDGSVTIFTKTGMMQTMVTDTAMLDQIIKGATVIDDHTMIVNHNGKMYLVKDTKLANGKMVSDTITEHSMGGGNH